MKPGENVEKEVLRVSHASLTRSDPENSPFKSECPVCKDGVLLVRRDAKSLKLVRDDSCVLCGQRFHYVDEKLGPENLQ